MKKIVIIIIAVLISHIAFAQSFEGKVTYINSFKSKIQGVADDQFTTMLGTKEFYYIKGGNYKTVTNGSVTEWQLYVNKENKLYTKVTSTDTLLWNDAGENQDSVISTQLNKNVGEIAGYACDEIILTCKSGTQTFYFNSKLRVDASLFAKHKYGNWYAYLKLANAVPLKMIIDNQQFTMESMATQVDTSKLDDKIFILPANAKSIKSPF